MDSSSVLVKREAKFDLEKKPILKKHKEISEEYLCRPRAESARGSKRKAKDDLNSKPILKKHKEISEKKEEKKTDEDEIPHFIMSLAESKKTLLLCHLSLETKISDILSFFKDAGEVVLVRLIIDETGKNLGYGSVQFASSNVAKKVQENKNGEYLCGNKITLHVAKISPYHPRHLYCIEHKVWSEAYLQREIFPIKEEHTPPLFSEATAARELLIANLCPHTGIRDIIKFFRSVVPGVYVRLIVNPEGKHVGYGFVRFPFPCYAKEALREKNGLYLHDHKIFLYEAKTAPSTPRQYSLAEKLWYEECFLREKEDCPVQERVQDYLLRAQDETLEGIDETPNLVEAPAGREKMVHVSNLHGIKLSDIIDFFKDVGEVVLVRCSVTRCGQHLEHGTVMFASADEAKKAQEEKNGQFLCGNVIKVVMPAYLDTLNKYCIDYKAWYEDYLRQESLLIEEDEAVEGLDETHDLFEEVAARKRTLFVSSLPKDVNIQKITNHFKDLGEVLSVRLSVDDEGQNVGCAYVEFASANEAEKLTKTWKPFRKGYFIGIRRPERAPYPISPRYKLAEKIWEENEKKKHAKHAKHTIFGND